MRILVTGAAGGIGSAIAAELAAAGHVVVRQDIRDSERDPVDFVGDLMDSAHLDELRRVAGSLDAVVAAHGIAAGRAFSAIDRAYSDRVMSINTLSMLRLYDAFADQLTGVDGVYVAISSQAGLVGEAGNGVYCASKFAVVGWAHGLRAVGSGPRVRILCPGATETPLLVQAFEGMAEARGITSDQLLAERSSQIPAGRLGRPSDLGAATRWLVELPEPRVLVAAVTGGEVLW